MRLTYREAHTACGSEEDSPTAAASDDDGYPRTVVDGTGAEVVLESRPTRIAVGQNVWGLDALLALGVAPVQFRLRDFSEYTGSPTTSWPWHEEALAALDGDAERVAVGETADVERISSSRPDLVVGDGFLTDVRGQLEQLAPVVQIADFDWRANLRLMGEVLDRNEEAEALITDSDATLAEALGTQDLGGATVAVFAVYDTSAFYLFGHDSIPTVDVLGRAGFGFLEDLTAGASAEEPRLELSIEELGRLAPADVLVVFDHGSAIGELSALSLYAQLPAVQAGRVVVVPQGELAQGLSVFGPLDVQLALDLARQAAALLA